MQVRPDRHHGETRPFAESGLPQSIIVTGAGPLITLAEAKALDALLLPKLPVIVPDMVRLAILQILDQPGAREVAQWIRRHDGRGVRVACTEVYEEFEVLRGVNAATKTGSRCEQAAVEVFWDELERRDAGAILLFDDDRGAKQTFLGQLPDAVVLTSTSEFARLVPMPQMDTAKRIGIAAGLFQVPDDIGAGADCVLVGGQALTRPAA